VKIVFVVPAADIRRRRLYRLASLVYGPRNATTGPLILGSILKSAGHAVEVYEELERDVDLEALKHADVVGIGAITSSAVRAYQIADFFRNELNKTVIIGGIHPSAMPEEALEHADQVVVGEAENVIVDVVEGRIQDKIVRAAPVEDIDQVPFPDYSLLQSPNQAANIMTSRGCPHNCVFCTTTRMYRPYRRRSPDNVIDELRYYKRLGFKYVNFEDDNFTADRERAKAILRGMIAEDLVFKESLFFGTTEMADDEELLELLRAANLRRVLVGFESLNQDSLDAINKRQSVDGMRRCGEKLGRHGIKLIASMVFGLDDDGKDDFRKAVEFCKELGAYQLQPSLLTPYPGTPVREQLEKQERIVIDDWQHYDMMNAVFEPKQMTSWELQAEFFAALREFYSIRSAFGFARKFGLETGLRRAGFWLMFQVGMRLFLKKSSQRDGNLYRQLKEASQSQLPAGRGRAGLGSSLS
jgi:radical SAM superfamily enzyme YgiQ (UPF0313 family)